jgi:hypothetical protein
MRGLVCASGEGGIGSSGQSCQVGVGCHPQLTRDRRYTARNRRTGPDCLPRRPQVRVDTQRAASLRYGVLYGDKREMLCEEQRPSVCYSVSPSKVTFIKVYILGVVGVSLIKIET